MKKVVAFAMVLMMIIGLAVPTWAEEEKLTFEAILLPTIYGTATEMMEDSNSRAMTAALVFIEVIIEMQGGEDEMDTSGLEEDCYIARNGSAVCFAFSMENEEKVLVVQYNPLVEEYTAGITDGKFIAAKLAFEELFNKVYTVEQEDLLAYVEGILDVIAEI